MVNVLDLWATQCLQQVLNSAIEAQKQYVNELA